MSDRTIFCDFDGVIRHWPAIDAVERECGLPLGAITRAAFADDLLLPAITGACDDRAWRMSIVDRLSLEHARDAAEQAVASWSGPCGDVDVRVLEWLDEVRSVGWRVFLATNATSRLDDDLRALGLLTRFDGVVNSSKVGAAKPHAQFYEAALTIADTTADQCIFIDDQDVNVKAASDYGMTGVRFRGFESVARLI